MKKIMSRRGGKKINFGLLYRIFILIAFFDQISNVISEQLAESFFHMEEKKLTSANTLSDQSLYYMNHKKLTSSSSMFNSSSMQVVDNTLNWAHAVFAADLDGDGDMDMLSGSVNGNTVAWYENNGIKGNPSFTKKNIDNNAVGAVSVYATDIDGDGDIDVLSASYLDKTVAWYENGGHSSNPTFTKRVITNTADGVRTVYATDIDGDGDMDVLSASYNDDTIAWYQNAGQKINPTFTKHIIDNDADGAYSVYAADIDGDGDMDVLSASLDGDTIAWYEYAGQSSNPTFTKRVLTTTADRTYTVYATDIDRDGDMDIIFSSFNDNKLAWLENSGQRPNPTFTLRIITTTAYGAHYVYAADIDGDGDTDILSASHNDNTVAWYENGGQSSNPTFTKRVITTAATQTNEVYAADIDGDGDIDVMSSGSNTIAWYRNYKLNFLNCATGKYYGVVNGSSACINFAVGFYQNKTGQLNCEGCPIGSYQDQTGQPMCISCPKNTYTNKEGQISRTSCKFKKIYKDFLLML